MIQPILIGIALLASALGFFNPSGLTPYTYDDGGSGLSFGATNFPTSLDSLTNPSATDSVATVSHSAQHANANDAIEALQVKLGIGASTATNNTIFVGTGTGSSAFSTFATTTSLVTTNFLANGSSTLQTTTMGSTTVSNLLANHSTTTNLFVSNLASTTNLRANVTNFGNSTIGSLTVTSCVGCSSSNAVSYYVATSSTNRYFAKTLTLAAGDVVVTQGSSQQNSDGGGLTYRISSPWSMATSTCTSTNSAGLCIFQATTTSTVTFAYQNGAATISSMLIQVISAFAQANVF